MRIADSPVAVQGEKIVDGHPRGENPLPLHPVPVGGNDHRKRRHEVRGDPQKGGAFPGGLPDAENVPVLEVAYPAVHHLEVVCGRGVGEILFFHQRHGEGALGGVPRRAGPEDPAADHHKIVFLLRHLPEVPVHDAVAPPLREEMAESKMPRYLFAHRPI